MKRIILVALIALAIALPAVAGDHRYQNETNVLGGKPASAYQLKSDAAAASKNADSLNHNFPDYDVDDMADTAAAKLPLHAKADTAADAVNARNADSLGHAAANTYAPLASPSFTTQISTPKILTSGTQTAGKVAWATLRQAIYIAGLNANCVAIPGCDSTAMEVLAATAGSATAGDALAAWCKVDTLVIMPSYALSSATPAGYFYYHITWFAP